MQLLCVLVLARTEGRARASGPIATTDGRMTVGSRTDPAVAVAWLPTASRPLGAEEIFTRPATCPRRLVGASKHTPLIFIRTHKTGSSTLQSIIHGLETPNHTLIKAGAHLKLVPNSGWQSKYACNQAEFGCPCEFPPRHAIHKSEFARYDIFSRHVTYGKPQLLHSLMRRPPLVVTVIRNSVSHLLSTLLYYDRSAYTPAKLRNDALRLARMRNINATFQGCLYLNGQAHDLGWYAQQDPPGSTAHDTDDKAIDVWLDSIESKLDLVILTEAFDCGIVVLFHLLKRCGWHWLEPRNFLGYKSINHNSAILPSSLVQPGTEELSIEAPFLRVDAALYERFSARFWRHSWQPSYEIDLKQMSSGTSA